MKRTAFLCFLTFSTLYYALQGQQSEVRFQHIGVEDGLSHSLVNAVVEDSLGFIWFGTQDGLNRYDGYEFKTYLNGFDHRSPSDSRIKSLYIDQSNQLWIFYIGVGLERFDPFTETFHQYVPDSLVPGTISSNSTISEINMFYREFFEDSERTLWIGTDHGLNMYDRENDTFRLFKHNPDDSGSLSDNRIVTFFEDIKGFLWIGTMNGLNRLDRKSGEVHRFMSGPADGTHINGKIITTGFAHPDGTIWVGTRHGGLNIIKNAYSDEPTVSYLIDTPLDSHQLPTVYNILRTSTGEMLVASHHGLYRVVREGNRYQVHLISETRQVKILQILEDSKGYIWAGSDESETRSLFRLSPDLRTTEVFETRDPDPFVYSGGRVRSLFESKTGIIWIATDKQGIYSVDLNARRFRAIDNYPGKGLFITNNEVYSIYEDKDRYLYIGTKTELNRINLNNGTLKEYNNKYSLKRNLTYEYADELPASLIGVLEPDHDGKIWIGAFDYKVSLYDPDSERFLNFHLNEQDSTAFRTWSLRSICVTHDRQVYLGGTGYGMCRLRPDLYSFEYFPIVNTGNESGTNDYHIQYIYEDREGILWLGTIYGGLNRFDPGTGVFDHFVNDPADPTTISNNRVKCILEPEIYGEDILWIGTNNGGLNRFDKATHTFTSYTVQEDLPSNTIHGILEDKMGNLWLSTNRGLVQFDPLTEKIKIFTTEDGLLGNEFNEGAFFKNRDGIMYFGGTNGVNYFDPAEIKEKTGYSARVVFTNFTLSGNPVFPHDTINGRVVLKKAIPYTDQITLTHKERFLSFEFASLDIASSRKIKYRYMLEGFEESWNKVDAGQRIISYTNLPMGDYTLRIMGTNSDGYWSQESTEIEIEVLPPFWQTLWFKILILSSILMIFLLYVQIRMRVLEKQKKNLEREVEERTWDLKKANHLLGERNDEIQQMAEKLHESDQMKLKFFTNISHEFRTPLTLIMGPTEQLLHREDFSDMTAVKQELGLIYRNERRLFKLINQLLEIRRVETGNLKLTVTEDDIAKYLESIYQLFIPFADKKQIDFRFSSNPSSISIHFDADKIEKIFYNLLSNAFKHTPERGRIQLTLDKEQEEGEDWLKVTVADSGVGIEEQYLPHIFDRFYQITNKHQSDKVSSGIGLSLSKDLVEKHHGKIDVSSKKESGTQFEVRIPFNKDTYNPEEILIESGSDLSVEYIQTMLETYSGSAEEINGTPLVGDDLFRILVVEDNLDMQRFLYNELSSVYNVMLAQNGKEGLLISKQNLPDLIISDIMMPEMDGIEFCQSIKEDELTSHIPFILLTAKPGPESQITGFEMGADDYITKPFNPEVLKLKIRNILESRKQLAEKFSAADNYIPDNIRITQIDQGFLEKFVKLVEDNIDDTEFSGDRLARELGMSKGNLYKKLKTLTGMSVNIYIRTIRLKVAARLLKQGDYNISEIAYSVGFSNPKYFSTCFSELFKVPPKEYMK
ncbi:MAG: two-component regulator propeller domain-containing protein [Bacteroidota bacterium]